MIAIAGGSHVEAILSKNYRSSIYDSFICASSELW